MNNYYNFIISALSVWRLTHLLTKEDGPFDLFFRLRQKVGAVFFGHLLDCFYCLSIWLALPFAIGLGTNLKEVFLLWLALSGAACLLEQGTTKGETAKVTYFED
jgi:hypothetical protein